MLAQIPQSINVALPCRGVTESSIHYAAHSTTKSGAKRKSHTDKCPSTINVDWRDHAFFSCDVIAFRWYLAPSGDSNLRLPPCEVPFHAHFIDGKGLINRKSRQNRYSRRYLLPNCYQLFNPTTKWADGLAVRDQPSFPLDRAKGRTLLHLRSRVPIEWSGEKNHAGNWVVSSILCKRSG